MREDPNKLRNKREGIATGIAETQMILKACYEQLIISKVGNLEEMTDICLHVCLCIVCMQCLQSPAKGVRSPGTGLTNECDLPCGYWDSNPYPLEM